MVIAQKKLILSTINDVNEVLLNMGRNSATEVVLSEK